MKGKKGGRTKKVAPTLNFNKIDGVESVNVLDLRANNWNKME